jgi:hypothetical protein
VAIERQGHNEKTCAVSWLAIPPLGRWTEVQERVDDGELNDGPVAVDKRILEAWVAVEVANHAGCGDN